MAGYRTTVPALALAALAATVGVVTVGGQSERAAGTDLQALVAEVRALRLAVERTSAHASQAQLLLGRVQLQEGRLATLGRQYQEARTRSLDAQEGHREAEARLAQLSENLRAATAPEHRQALEDGLSQLKRELASHQSRTEQLRIDEAAALEALTTEQHRWSAFNERLEALERALGAPPQTR